MRRPGPPRPPFSFWRIVSRSVAYRERAMTTKRALLVALLLAATPQAAQAGDMSYSYVDLAYVHLKQENSGSNDGGSLRASIGGGENFFAFGEYTTFPRGRATNVDFYAAGVGGHFAISDRADVVARVGWAGASAGGSSDSGYVVSAGARVQPADRFELEGHVVHTSNGSRVGNNLTELAIAGRYFFTEHVAFGVEFRTSIKDRDQTKMAIAGVRI